MLLGVKAGDGKRREEGGGGGGGRIKSIMTIVVVRDFILFSCPLGSVIGSIGSICEPESFAELYQLVLLCLWDVT